MPETMFEEGGAGDGKGAQYHCDYCRKDITNVVRIKCAECKDFDLCLECFSVGVEVFPHRNFHSYRVMDHVTTPIFEEGWGADEELLLLEAIEMFGFGNWSEVADHVGQKTKEQCEAHYHTVYLSSATAPFPDLNAPVRSSSHDSLAFDDDNKLLKVKAKAKVKAAGKNLSIAEAVGYAEKRQEFEMEYENDAEGMLAEMSFTEDDTAWERELKLKICRIYNTKLDARLERKKFIAERGLLYKKDKRPKEEEEIAKGVKVFARFQRPEEHEAFIQGLVRESYLRKRIEQLQSYRLMGFRAHAEVEEYEKEKARKEDGKKKEVVTPGESVKKKNKEKNEPALLDLTGVEGAELLSEGEKDLCSQLGLHPQHYMVIKDKLTSESYTRGFLQPGQARQLLKLDVAKTDKVFDFFVSVGWVHSVPDEPVKKEQPPPSPPAPSYSAYPTFYPSNPTYPPYPYSAQQPSFPPTPFLPPSSSVPSPSFQFPQGAQNRQLPYNSMLYTTPAAFPSSPTSYPPQATYAPAYPYTTPLPFKPYPNSTDPPTYPV